jgi:roadblock/LC7 domain-containing protein
MENKSKIAVYLSSDGKLTVEYHAETWEEEAKMYTSAVARFRLMVALMTELDLKKKAFNPAWKGGVATPKAPPVIVASRVCPKCGSKLVDITTKTGKRMFKCSTATWDPKTKVAGGCDFIEWQNDVVPASVTPVDPKVVAFDKENSGTESPPFYPPTIGQAKVIKELYPAQWRDNLTYEEAQKIIVTNSSK